MIKQILALVAVTATVGAANAQSAPAAQSNSPARTPTTRAGVLQSIDANFKRVDANGDGALTKAEIETAQLRVREAASASIGTRMEQQFARLDTNRDGQLSLAEFKAAAPTPKTAAANEQALERLDANKDGRVTQAEFRTPALANFDRMDANRDGTISAEELRARRAAQAR